MTKGFGEWFRKNVTSIGPIIAAIVVIGVFQLINPVFLKYQGIITLIYAMSYFLIAACGLTFVIMLGSFDFSVVSILKLSALICVIFFDRFGLWVIPIAILVCVVFGVINGLLFAKLKVPSFMATLGVSIVVEGIVLYVSKGFLHIMNDTTFRSLAVTFIAKLPSIFYWAIGIWLISSFIAIFTPFGRRIYAIGGNPTAAVLSGINLDRYRIYVFMLSSFFAGIAGVLYMAQSGGGSIEIGADMAIPLFASVVAGGTALSGGVGGPQRTLVGVVIITWIQSGLLMLGYGREIQVVVFGFIAIIMAIVTIDRRRGIAIK
ncbi:MAG: ABC transporter permease [Chitinophagaceae bacterium]